MSFFLFLERILFFHWKSPSCLIWSSDTFNQKHYSLPPSSSSTHLPSVDFIQKRFITENCCQHLSLTPLNKILTIVYEETINMSPSFEWQTAISQPACSDKTHHSFKCKLLPQFRFISLHWTHAHQKGQVVAHEWERERKVSNMWVPRHFCQTLYPWTQHLFSGDMSITEVPSHPLHWQPLIDDKKYVWKHSSYRKLHTTVGPYPGSTFQHPQNAGSMLPPLPASCSHSENKSY